MVYAEEWREEEKGAWLIWAIRRAKEYPSTPAMSAAGGITAERFSGGSCSY